MRPRIIARATHNPRRLAQPDPVWRVCDTCVYPHNGISNRIFRQARSSGGVVGPRQQAGARLSRSISALQLTSRGVGMPREALGDAIAKWRAAVFLFCFRGVVWTLMDRIGGKGFGPSNPFGVGWQSAHSLLALMLSCAEVSCCAVARTSSYSHIRRVSVFKNVSRMDSAKLASGFWSSARKGTPTWTWPWRCWRRMRIEVVAVGNLRNRLNQGGFGLQCSERAWVLGRCRAARAAAEDGECSCI